MQDCDKHLAHVKSTIVEKALLKLEDDILCLGPEAALPGIAACVILGCSTPMILRPTPDEQCLVVGDCSTHGVMQGEALIGDLQSNLRVFQRLRPGGRHKAIIHGHSE